MAEAARIVTGPRGSAHVYGEKVWSAAVAAGIPRMNCPRCREVLIPANRAQDLATWLELHKRWAVVEAVLV
jgi:hypothetical protein